MNHFVARCKSRSFYNRTFSVRLSSCSWMIALAWRDNTLRVYTLKNYFQQFKVKSMRSYFIKLPVDSYMHRKDHCQDSPKALTNHNSYHSDPADCIYFGFFAVELKRRFCSFKDYSIKNSLSSRSPWGHLGSSLQSGWLQPSPLHLGSHFGWFWQNGFIMEILKI